MQNTSSIPRIIALVEDSICSDQSTLSLPSSSDSMGLSALKDMNTEQLLYLLEKLSQS
jgi:hypothetical protein